MAFVYLIGDSGQDNIFKIGVTKGSIEKRLKKLQTGNGEELYLAGYYETEHPFLIEKLMHDRYFGGKKLNEWFEMDALDVSSFSENCKKMEDNIMAIKDNEFIKKYLK